VLKKRLIIGISGASGSCLGVYALEALRDLPDWESHLIISRAAARTIRAELDILPEEVEALADIVYDDDDVGAAISSGSYHTEGMLIVPCSMKTAAGIASGYTDNLICRAADVVIKERRKLVLIAREAPLSSIHLRNLLTLSDLGAVIMPPVPAFYQKPDGVGDIVKHTVGRSLGYFGIDTGPFFRPWQGEDHVPHD